MDLLNAKEDSRLLGMYITNGMYICFFVLMCLKHSCLYGRSSTILASKASFVHLAVLCIGTSSSFINRHNI